MVRSTSGRSTSTRLRLSVLAVIVKCQHWRHRSTSTLYTYPIPSLLCGWMTSSENSSNLTCRIGSIYWLIELTSLWPINPVISSWSDSASSCKATSTKSLQPSQFCRERNSVQIWSIRWSLIMVTSKEVSFKPSIKVDIRSKMRCLEVAPADFSSLLRCSLLSWNTSVKKRYMLSWGPR